MYVTACRFKYKDLGVYYTFHNVDDYLMLLLQKQITIDDKITLVS